MSIEEQLRLIIREELESYFGKVGADVITEYKVDEPVIEQEVEPIVPELIEPEPVSEPEAMTTVELLAKLRDFGKENDCVPAIKKVVADMGFAKVSEVPDEEAAKVYAEVMEAM